MKVKEVLKHIDVSKKASDITVDADGTIVGYASVFGGIDSAGDTISPFAYNNILDKAMPAMLFNHDDWELPIGKWTEMSVDEKGLKVKGQLNLEDERAKKIYQAIKFGSINGLSVRLLLDEEDLEYSKDYTSCLIKNVKRLPEISVVTMPADDCARIDSCKSIDNVRDFESALRDLGASQKQALTIISQAKKLFANQSDSDNKELSDRLNKLAQLSKLN